MSSLGSAALGLAFLTALYAVFAGIRGRHGDRRWIDSARRAVYALCALLTLCVVVIEIAFARNDFSFNIVAQHSSTTTPAFYKFTAMWSSQEGSLLLWAWVLSIASSIALRVTRNRLRELVPWATAVMAGIGSFFIGLMLFAANVDPFATLNPAPAEGQGLEPLLRHPSMMIHPPMLYSGYVALTIPFAFAIAALITRRLDSAWIRSTRRFALVAWTFLGIGLLFGARWSYTELGWGGYWAWDPVENAALMPFLAATAFLHSVMVQEKRGMLKVWNVSLIVGTFSLALFGTFLVRSGVLESIHAFGDSTVGPYILGLIAVVLFGSTALIVSRLSDLRSEKRIDSLVSRESVFLINNLLLVGLVVVIFWGTVFPLVSEAFTGDKASLGAPWFDHYVTPLAIVLVLFTGIGPLLAWRRVSWASARRVFFLPALAAALLGVLLAITTDATHKPWAFVLFVAAAFAIAGLAQEFWQGAAARRSLSGGSIPGSMLGLAARNRRRYGGYVVHVGIAVLLIGIAASSSFQSNREVSLGTGQSTKIDGYTVTNERPTVNIDNERISFGAVLNVTKDGKPYATLTPTRHYYRPATTPLISSFWQGESTSEVGLKAGAARDVWTAIQPNIGPVLKRARSADKRFRMVARARMGAASALPPGPQRLAAQRQQAAFLTVAQGLAVREIANSYLKNPPPATFHLIVNPLVTWLWIGALIALAGALIAVWPSPPGARRRAGSPSPATVDRGLSRA